MLNLQEKKTHELIPLERLKLSSRNVRKTFARIEELAQSIKEIGLLQNLVVHAADNGFFEIQAGSRRFKALCYLRDTHQIDSQYEVPCLVNPHDAFEWVNLSENINREDVPPWHVGFRMAELLEAGFTQKEIAEHLGRSQGYISLCVQISLGIHESVISRLDKIRPGHITQRDCRRLCNLKDRNLHPDEKAQHEFLDRLLGDTRSGKALKRTARQTLVARYRKLHSEILPKLPRHHAPLAEAIVDYLSGKTRRFRLP